MFCMFQNFYYYYCHYQLFRSFITIILYIFYLINRVFYKVIEPNADFPDKYTNLRNAYGKYFISH